jgi:hypothetical protein
MPLEDLGKPGQMGHISCSNPLGDNTVMIKQNTETLIDASKEVGLEVNTEKLYVAVSSPECKEKSHHIDS